MTPPGRRLQPPLDLPTPALVVDLDRLEDNIESMARAMRERGVALRPHAKTHKCPEIARLQLDAGAVGLTVATLGEAEVFAEAGFDDLFIAYPLWVSDVTVDRVKRLSETVHLRVGVESLAAARALARAAAGVEVALEIDSGQHRTGVPPGEVVGLARGCEEIGLRVVAVFTHGGHVYGSRGAAAAAAADESRTLSEAVELLSRDGFDVAVTSAGSTPTALESATGAVNEERPGVYVFYDRQQVELEVCDPNAIAAFVLATVVSIAHDGHFVVDAGSKALAGDRPQWLEGYGVLPDFYDTTVVRLWEHHGVVRCGGPEMPNVGEVIAIVPNHICTVVNLFDSYALTRNGSVVGRWEIAARGS